MQKQLKFLASKNYTNTQEEFSVSPMEFKDYDKNIFEVSTISKKSNRNKLEKIKFIKFKNKLR